MRLLVVYISLAALFVGCGKSDPADDAVAELVTEFGAGDYAAAYDSLHPAHQSVVSQQLFIDCGRQAQRVGNVLVDEFDITNVSENSRTVPELGEVEVTTVSVELTQGDQVFPRSWDVVRADGEWRWLLDDEPLNEFREGRCPGEAASAQP